MQTKYRRVIFYIFILLFLSSIPFILLYTAGWSYNSKKNKFEKTGSLLINTVTKNTVLYLNNRPYYSKNEFRIKNLLPGEYEVKLMSPGYFDWQKKLPVQSELTTFVKDMRLFQHNLPLGFVNQKINSIYPAPDKNKILYIARDEKTGKYAASTFDADKGGEKNILQEPQLPINISWSADGSKFFVQTQSGFKIYDMGGNDISPAFLKNKIYNLRWGENGSELFAESQDGIYKIDFFFKTASKIYNITKANDFIVAPVNMYVADGRTLLQINLADKITVAVPLERNNYKIKSIINNKIYLLNPSGNLQVFNLPLEALSTPVLLANAKDFDVLGDNLLYYSDFELWTYNFGSGAKELITRIGAEIKKARWLDGASNILFILDNQLKIIELDKRDGRQIWELVKFDAINDFVFTKKYNILFTGQVNKAAGIYKLEL